jgi:cathepsin B
MKEIYTNGPVMMGLIIYEDFMSYAGGIYHYILGEEIGGHAMKAVGYGHDDKHGHYWILQN